MAREPLSILIPTYNEARNLPDCLASIEGLGDEIVVVDSFSDDATVDLATAAHARVLRHEFVNDGVQKNWAIPQCRHRWVLIIDADERVTPELRADILRVLDEPPARRAAAYAIARTTFFLDIEITRCGWDTDRVVRLFDRTRARYPALEVHGDLVVEGDVRRLDGRLHHYPYRTFDDYLDKLRRYTTWSANDLWRRGTRTGLCKLATRPIGRFLKMYVIRRGFMDGTAGFIVCALAAVSVLVRYAKLWSMQRAMATGARSPDGRRVIHAGAAILDQDEIISGGRAPARAMSPSDPRSDAVEQVGVGRSDT